MRPDEATYRRVLERRAELLAQVPEGEERRAILAMVVVLEIGDERLGVPIEALSEIVPLRSVTALPGLPDHIRGIAQVRGALLSVVDLARWLNLGGTSCPRYLCVIEGSVGAIGILADAVLDVREVKDDELASSLGQGELAGSRLLRGTTRDLVSLLDADALLQSNELIVGRVEVPGGPGASHG